MFKTLKDNIHIQSLQSISKWFYTTRLSTIILLCFPPFLLLLMLIPSIRDIVTPFLYAAAVAYVLTPVLNLLWKRFKIPRTLSILVLFIAVLVGFGLILTRLIVLANSEVRQLIDETSRFDKYIDQLPDWSQGFAEYTVGSLGGLKNTHVAAFPLLENTVTKVIHFFAFFISVFYFLKDADKVSAQFSQFKLYAKLNKIVQSYFRGQLLLIAIMAVATWIFLSVVGVKYAIILGILSGLLEIIPYIGPILAATIAILVTFITGTTSFGGSNLATLAIIAIGYFLLRQIEDLLVIPLVLSRSVKLHPLVVLLTTLIAGKLFGLLGLLFGVPFVASYKVILEYIVLHKAPDVEKVSSNA
jgi:predicted PurR-regulated permease PerM